MKIKQNCSIWTTIVHWKSLIPAIWTQKLGFGNSVRGYKICSLISYERKETRSSKSYGILQKIYYIIYQYVQNWCILVRTCSNLIWNWAVLSAKARIRLKFTKLWLTAVMIGDSINEIIFIQMPNYLDCFRQEQNLYKTENLTICTHVKWTGWIKCRVPNLKQLIHCGKLDDSSRMRHRRNVSGEIIETGLDLIQNHGSNMEQLAYRSYADDRDRIFK